MSLSELNRGDLVRVMSLEDPNVVSFMARSLGLREVIAVDASEASARPAERRARTPLETSDAPWPDSQAPVPFWQAIEYRPRDAEGDAEEAPSAHRRRSYSQWRHRPDEDDPVPALLSSWRELAPRLRKGLISADQGMRTDIPRLVKRVARCHSIAHIPKRPLRRWGSSVLVIIDFSERLIPYRHDQEYVAQCLRRWLPDGGLRIATCSNPEEGLTEWQGTSQFREIDLAPGEVVIVLGDLGVLDTRRERSDPCWLRWGHSARRNRNRLLALVPCPQSKVPERLRKVFGISPWRAMRMTDHDVLAQDRRRTDLLAAVSAAIRLEPGLLRDIRSASVAWADPALEAEVWQDQALISGHPVAASFDADSAKELMVRFERLDPGIRQRVLSEIRRWHSAANVDDAIWLEEIRRLSAESRQLLSESDVEDALAQATYFEERTKDAQSLPTGMLGYLTRMLTRPPDSALSDEVVGPAYRAIRKITHPASDPTAAPFADPREEPRGERPLALSFAHQGSSFIVSRDGFSGSPVAALNSTNGMVAIETGHRPARPQFWKRGVAPPWAKEWGHDDFGAWAIMGVPSPDQRDMFMDVRLRWIPAGSFLMGSPEDEPERSNDEGPQHQVTISKGFWLCECATTQALWECVMGENPSHFRGPNRPVEQVSWKDCERFFDRLREVSEIALELPSEAQWEYACRAGTTTPFSFGESITTEQANYDGNYPYAGHAKGEYRKSTVDVDVMPPNRWGLFGMHGNVHEWCRDGMREYGEEAMTDPVGPDGSERVVRGGSWFLTARVVRSAYRSASDPGLRSPYIGFRPALVQGASGAEPESSSPRLEAEPSRGEMDSGVAERTMRRVEDRLTFATTVTKRVRVLTDVDDFILEQREKPSWATSMARDRYGLYAAFSVESKDGPVEATMRWIPPGRFVMGSSDEADSLVLQASPAHEVLLTRGFWLMATPLTQALWIAIMGENPSRFEGPQRPVEKVSWNDCQEFVTALSKRLSIKEVDGRLTLPTEAQWEYACRAGTQTAYAFGDEIDSSMARFDSADGTCFVGEFQPNRWGLFDMHGNVWEWCLDGAREYESGRVLDPVGDSRAGSPRVLRGGGWIYDARDVRSAYRDANDPDRRNSNIGFRPALVQGTRSQGVW